MGAGRDSVEEHEREKRLAAEAKQRALHADLARREAWQSWLGPGKWTGAMDQLGELAAMPGLHAGRGTLADTPWPDSPRSPFDAFVARGVQDVSDSLTARAPAIAPMAASGSRTGAAMWQVAERRAATLYRHAQDHGDVSADDPIVDEALARIGGGSALPAEVRRVMEQELGVSLARVRVHTDSVAAEAARAVHAEAFTVGEDIFFAPGTYAPTTSEGQKLLAHELAHVVQGMQGRAHTGGGRRVTHAGESLEIEADRIADRVANRVAAPRAVAAPAAAHAPTVAPAPAPAGNAMLLRKVKKVGKNRKPPTGPKPEEAAKLVGAVMDILNHSVVIEKGEATPKDFPAAHPEVPAELHPLLEEWWRITAGTWTEKISGSMTYWYKGPTLTKHLEQALAVMEPYLAVLRKDASAAAYIAENFDARVAEIRERATQETVTSAVDTAADKRETGGLDLGDRANAEQLHIASITALKVIRAVITASTRISSLNLNEAKAADKLHVEMVGEDNVVPEMLREGRAKTIHETLGHAQGVVYLIQTISNIADHKKRYDAYKAQWTRFGKIAGSTEFMKDLGLALGGVTTLCNISAIALAKATENAELVKKLVALSGTASKWMTKINIALNALGVIHGAAVLLNPESTAAEKAEAGVEATSGALGLLGRFIPRIAPVTTAMTVSMLVNFYMFKHLLELTAGAEAGMVAMGMNMCYANMLETGKLMSQQATHYATALDLQESGTFTDPAQKAELDKQVEANRWNLVEQFIKPFLAKATSPQGARNQDPGAYTVLARKFAALGKPTLDTPDQTIDFSAKLIGTLAECFANAQDIYVQQVHEVMTGAPKPAAAVQKKAAGSATGNVQQAAARGTSGTAGALPYIDQIQRSFGRHDVSGIKAHADGNAAAGARAMGAEAFAMGDRVAFSRSPDLHTAAHEAAHVIQQRAGVHLSGGVGSEGDSYERHADQVADLVVQGKSAEALLDRYAGGAGAGGGTGVQRKVGLEFETGVKVSKVGHDKDGWFERDVGYKTKVGNGEGWHIEADSSKLEFVTDPFSDRDDLANVMATIEEIVGNMEVSIASSAPIKPEIYKASNRKSATKRETGYVIGEGQATKFNASPQASGGVPLDQLANLFRTVGQQKLDLGDNAGQELRGEANLMGMNPIANKVVTEGATHAKSYIEWWIKEEAKKGKKVEAWQLASLEGLLAMVYSYIVQGAKQKQVYKYSKMIAPIMSRVDFGSLHASLTDDEKAAFAPASILSVAKFEGGENMFAKGYGSKEYGDVHFGPTREDWLVSIQNDQFADAMSFNGGTSVATGQNSRGENVGNSGTSTGMGNIHAMDTAEDGTPLAVIELRRLPKTINVSNWTKVALTVYDYFATFDPSLKPRERGMAIGGGVGSPKAAVVEAPAPAQDAKPQAADPSQAVTEPAMPAAQGAQHAAVTPKPEEPKPPASAS